MAEALADQGGEVVYGDLLFGLGVDIPLRSFRALERAARVVLPVIVNLPFTWFYPTGEKQNEIEPKYENYYKWADVLAGDFLLIRRHMPDDLAGKIVLTNTTTESDRAELEKRGVKLLVTTTPEFDGRTFGTNVMEAVLVASSGKNPNELNADDYMRRLRELGWKPSVQSLGGSESRA